MKKSIFLFAVLTSFSSALAMNKSQLLIENLQLKLREAQVAVCEGDDQHPGCVALRNFLDSSCQAYRSTSAYYQGLCDLADQMRSKSSLTAHLQEVHKMPYDTATECENYLERLTDK